MESSEVQAKRGQKQAYLRDQIISGGYDPERFKEYLDNIKPDGGSNIDIWTLEELIEVVNNFKQAIQTSENDLQQAYEQTPRIQEQASRKIEEFKEPSQIFDDNDEYEISIHDEHTAEVKLNSLHIQLKPPNGSLQKPSLAQSSEIKSEDDRFNKIVKCRMSMHTALNDEKNIEIFVGDPELVKGGFFTSSYIMYKITTKPFSWTVKRRYSDFYWLRGFLTKIYPQIIVPPIPKKKNKGSLENQLIGRRIALLEKFLNNCLEIEEIKSNQIFLAFLQATDEEKWKIKKKEADAMKRSNNFHENENLNGQVFLQIRPDLKEFANLSSEFVNQSEPIYRKMRRLAKQLLLDFSQASNTIFSFGDCFAELYTISNRFNKKLPMGQNPTLDDVYLTLNNLMVTWGEQMLGEIKIVQQDLQNFFKYSYSEYEPMKEALKQRATFANDFIKFKKTLDAKKEKNFASGDLSRCELDPIRLKGINQAHLLQDKELAFSLMFPKETAQEYELRDRFAFYNYEFYSEFTAAIKRKCKAYMKNFQTFANEQIDNISSVHIHWADVLAHFSNSNSGHSKNAGLMDRSNVIKPSAINESLLAEADLD